MSDEEEVSYVKKPRTIHYGSLEDGEKARLEAANEESKENPPSTESPQAAPQIHISNGKLVFIAKFYISRTM